MGKIIDELFLKISAKDDGTLNKTLKKAKDEVKSLTGEITSLATKASIAFSAIALGSSLMIKSWLDSAGAMEQYKAKLVTVLKSTSEAEETLRRSVEYAAKTPFDVRGIVDATVKLEVYGVKSREILPLVGDLAAGMGKQIDNTALVIGKAFSGSLEGFESLRNEYGISTAKLAKYGAVMNATGGISVRTTADLEKARNALSQIIKIEFGGAVERQSKTLEGAFSNLRDSVDKLKVSLGEQLIPVFTVLARGATNIIESLSGMPKEFKSIIAYSALGITAFSTFGVAISGLVAVLPSLVAGLNIVKPALVGLIANISNLKNTLNTAGYSALNFGGKVSVVGGAIGAVAVGVTAGVVAFNLAKGAWTGLQNVVEKNQNSLAGGLAKIGQMLIQASPIGYLAVATAKWEKYTEDMTREIGRQEKALKVAREIIHDYANKSAEDLVSMGVTSREMGEKQKELADGAKQAFEKYRKSADLSDLKTGRWFVEQMKKAEEYKLAIEAIEPAQKAMKISMNDIANEAKILNESEYFDNPTKKAEYFHSKILDMAVTLNNFKQMQDLKVNFLLDAGNINDVKTKIIEVKKALSELEQKKEETQDDKEKKKYDMQAQLLKNYLSMIEMNYENEKKIRDDKIQFSKDFIRKEEDLNRISLQEKVSANERILNEMKKQNRSEKELSAQRHEIAKIENEIKKEVQEKNAGTIELEIQQIEKLSDGQIREYDKIIKKIKEYINTRQIDAKKGQKFIQDIQTEKKLELEKKDQEKKYEKVEEAQQNSLSKMEKVEQKSVSDRIQLIDSFIRFWEGEESKRPAFKAKIEERIKNLVKERQNIEADTIKANIDAEKELRNIRKDSLDYEIGKLSEKLEAGENIESKLMEKIKERHELELKSIQENIENMRRQGINQTTIDRITAETKTKLNRKEMDELDSLIEKIKQKNKEDEKKTEYKPILTEEEVVQDILRRRRENTIINSGADTTQTLNALESMKRQRESENQSLESIVNKQITPIFDIPANKFSTATSLFSQSVKDMAKNFEQFFKNGIKVPQEYYNLRNGITTNNNIQNTNINQIRQTENKPVGQSGIININLTINGNQVSANQQGVTATRTQSGGIRAEIPNSVIQNSFGNVPPTGYSSNRAFSYSSNNPLAFQYNGG